MPNIKCFWLEPTGRAKIFLRRYSGQKHCAVEPLGYHNAIVPIGERPMLREEGGYWQGGLDTEHPHDDAAWPKTCACGYVFEDSDNWQHGEDTLYQRADTGAEMTLRDAPAGAMWDAWWFRSRPPGPPGTDWVGPDGISLMVKTPGGDWCVDGPANNGSGWTRTGTVPNVTATPSIGAGGQENGQYRYHGWLRDGFLVDA